MLNSPQFPTVLLRIVELSPDRTQLLLGLDTVSVKMAASLFYSAQESREFADLFFKKLFPEAEIDYGVIFATMHRIYNTGARAARLYVQLVESVSRIVGKHANVELPEIELFAALARPLIGRREAKKTIVTVVRVFSQFAVNSKQSAIAVVARLIAEFTTGIRHR
jgi:hypothetical protein